MIVDGRARACLCVRVRVRGRRNIGFPSCSGNSIPDNMMERVAGKNYA